MNEFDSNRDGKITFPEFLNCMWRLQSGPSEKEIVNEMFQVRAGTTPVAGCDGRRAATDAAAALAVRARVDGAAAVDVPTATRTRPRHRACQHRLTPHALARRRLTTTSWASSASTSCAICSARRTRRAAAGLRCGSARRGGAGQGSGGAPTNGGTALRLTVLRPTRCRQGGVRTRRGRHFPSACCVCACAGRLGLLRRTRYAAVGRRTASSRRGDGGGGRWIPAVHGHSWCPCPALLPSSRLNAGWTPAPLTQPRPSSPSQIPDEYTLAAMIREADLDQDGRLNPEEFAHVVEQVRGRSRGRARGEWGGTVCVGADGGFRHEAAACRVASALLDFAVTARTIAVADLRREAGRTAAPTRCPTAPPLAQCNF